MTPTDQLTELWELLGKGTHEAWPDCVALQHGQWRYNGSPMRPEHALAIARDHIEGWLVEMGFEIGIEPGSRNYYWYDGSSGEWICTLASEALADAVRYALGKDDSPSVPADRGSV